MMGPGFGDAVVAAILRRFFKIVVIPFGGLCIAIGLLIGWLI